MTRDLPATIRDRVAAARREHRLPSLVVGIGQAGKALCVEADGFADVPAARSAERATQYRIGSITKTFTAATVLLLAESGQLDLDEPIERYLPGTPLGRARLRQVLAHCGGLQREAPNPMWTTMHGPTPDELLQSLDDADMVDRPGARWHYSNLGYAVLGQVVAAVTGTICERLIDTDLLQPLGLTSTTWHPTGDPASGYRLDPYQDTVHPEPVMDQRAIGVGGQLWSTADDLLTWADALLGGAPHVLPEPVTRAMHTPHVMVDTQRWTQGWGLGLILDRRGNRIISGHTGAMPGFLAALAMDRSARTAVTVFTNVTRGVRPGPLAAEILDDVLTHLPAEPSPTPPSTQPAPPDAMGVLGRWWCEAEETVFIWHDGALHAHLADQPATTRSTFTRLDADHYRVASGRLQGERLRVMRDPDGNVTELEWATYPFTRTPR